MTPEKRPHSVLIIDDDPMNLLIYARALSRRGYDVVAVESAEAARVELEKQIPDIILLDIFMPKTSGFEMLAEIRKGHRTSSIPVILISALSDTNHIVEGLERGANDYVTKPVIVPVLTARMEALLRANALVKHLEVQTELLAKLAAFDDLTGIYNRRSLFHALETELARSARYSRSVSVLMIDIDRFKRVNDVYGHAFGDAVLRQVAETVVGSLRTIDVVCRYGGEEFCVILPETSGAGARRAAERVRLAIMGHTFALGDQRLDVTVSIGVATWAPEVAGRHPDLLLDADRALYEAKQLGRNQVRVSGGGLVELPS
jgi:two-component system, cell cycle response regulator